jgi:hypothetical protein
MARQPAKAIRRIGNLDEGPGNRAGDVIGVRPSQFARGGNRDSSLHRCARKSRAICCVLQRTKAQDEQPMNG